MTTTLPKPDQFERFRQFLATPDLIKTLRSGLIGENVQVPGLNGSNPMIYADYVASGRALAQVEDWVTNDILPYYANSHTEASFCGQMMTRLRRQARQIILENCGADARYDVIFTGSGATAGINRLVGLLGVSAASGSAKRPVVFIGPYEHHSNILPWRESGAEIIEIPEAVGGGPDQEVLQEGLKAHVGRLGF